MPIEPCWLTNQTGAIIRFRPSQLRRLPTHDTDLLIKLFDGEVVRGRFHRHSANPYVAGREVRQFIIERVPDRSREQALIDISGRYWQLFETTPVGREVKRYGVSAVRARSGKLTGSDLERILKTIDRITRFKRRLYAYERLLRPPGLRRIVLQLMGASCQAAACTAAETAVDEWGDQAAGIAILEVHHIEAVAQCADHSPRNLCVLCGNHHRLIHGFGPWSIAHANDDIILRHQTRELRIVRDLSFLANNR